jgi:hypothetical protein
MLQPISLAAAAGKISPEFMNKKVFFFLSPRRDEEEGSAAASYGMCFSLAITLVDYANADPRRLTLLCPGLMLGERITDGRAIGPESAQQDQKF